MMTNFLYRTIHFYYDGFRHMTVGRTLWAVIIVKLIIIFLSHRNHGNHRN